MNCCIVNVATGDYWKGQDRLRRSLAGNFSGGFLAWTNQMPPGSPAHADMPYGFKIYAFREAERCGYDKILWLDSSMWAVRPLDPLFERIAVDGCALFVNVDWTLGQWCSDAAMQSFGSTRDELLALPLIHGGIVGIDLKNALGAELLHRWQASAENGVFVGTHRNVNGSASNDPRVCGHLHDMPALSFHASALGLPLTKSPDLFDFWSPNGNPEQAVIVAAGM